MSVRTKQWANSGSMTEWVLIYLRLKFLTSVEHHLYSFGSANTRGRNCRKQIPNNMKKLLREKHSLLVATQPEGNFLSPASLVSNENEQEMNEDQRTKQLWGKQEMWVSKTKKGGEKREEGDRRKESEWRLMCDNLRDKVGNMFEQRILQVIGSISENTYLRMLEKKVQCVSNRCLYEKHQIFARKQI